MKRVPFSINSLVPLNKDEEREKFFFDERYNPQFTYEQEISGHQLGSYSHVSDQYVEVAQKILDTVIKKWGSESAFLAEAEGRVLKKEEVSSLITEYLKANKLDHLVTVRYSTNLVSRTLVDGFVMNIRLPIEYREKSFRGVLDHELGTHVLRRINDRKQPWYGDRKKYGLRPYLETEEGLSSLHSHISMEHTNMWLKAGLYLAVHLAQQMSFADLNDALKAYVDSKDRRWNMCLRVKRGIKDTSIPGVFPKDQIYLNGVIRVLKWMEKHDYDITRLYYGKIDVLDAVKAGRINPEYAPVLPRFFADGKEAYKSRILEIRKTNFL